MQLSHLLTVGTDDAPQASADSSFIGGRPRLPAGEGLPACGLCGAEQTFFFQIELPDGPWAGLSIVVFACMDCADDDYLIPEMLTGALKGADIPDGFLHDYQKNFRILVVDASDAAPDGNYRERIAFKRLTLSRDESLDKPSSRVGGEPAWMLDDESPATYASHHRMFFLMQLEPGLTFETVDGAPKQIEAGFDGTPQASPYDTYELFLGNGLYLFGTEDRDVRAVYALTQVD